MVQTSLFSAPALSFVPGDSALLLLDRTRLGISRKIDLRKLPDLSPELRSELVSAQARILDCPELKAIMSLDAELSAWIRRYSTPSLFRWGAYLFRISQATNVNAKLSDIKSRRTPQVALFCQSYERITREARAKLGPVLEEAINWPSPETIRERFLFEWRWARIGFPSELQAEAPEMASAEAAKWDADTERQSTLIQQTLRKELLSLVQAFVDRLEPTDPPRIFRDSLVENFVDWFSILPNRLLVPDPDLLALAKKGADMLFGIQPEELRESPLTRTMLWNGMRTLEAEIEPLIIRTSTRAISFDDEAA
jgi:hypothetical protein